MLRVIAIQLFPAREYRQREREIGLLNLLASSSAVPEGFVQKQICIPTVSSHNTSDFSSRS